MKIVVLAGGLSPERNVSLSSGAMVCEALRARGHQAVDMPVRNCVDLRAACTKPFQ